MTSARTEVGTPEPTPMMQTLAVPVSPLPRRTLLAETVLVLGVSLGASAIWAVLSILRKLTAEAPLSA